MSKDEALESIYRDLDNDPNPLIANLRRGAKQLVPGDGELRHPRLILVGDAPGATDDRFGSPFSGNAGKLLDELLLVAHLDPDSVWTTNVLKYRPMNNRTPTPEEVAAFKPYLEREVALVAGAGCSMIVGLGRIACLALAGEGISVVQRSGSWEVLPNGFRLFISCHPLWGVRNPGNRRKMVQDFDRLRKTML